MPYETVISLDEFRARAAQGNVIALSRRLMSDQLTPVLGYRRLVAPDERTAPSFLFESVESGETVGRHSYIGAQPAIEVFAYGHDVTVVDLRRQTTETKHEDDPLSVLRRLMKTWQVVPCDERVMPRALTGGWVGFAGYDTVRYLEPEKLPFGSAPSDDRRLPDFHFGLYHQMGVFDHVDKLLYAISHVWLDEYDSIEEAYKKGHEELERFVSRLETHSVPLPPGSVTLDLKRAPTTVSASTFTKSQFESAVNRCKEYIAAGDAFQIVISQRFARETSADPFHIYRALRIVNPSPYMIYLQAKGCILVASSPEILCRCQNGVVTNRPLAGTRRRGATDDEDSALERELASNAKECAEHVMLVDLGRNDLGRVCEAASVHLDRVMAVERYSHVMHLSSTITGRLSAGLDCWDALRNTLPVGTVSGAPKVRAMQIIDELERTKRGPYAGGIGAVSFDGDMDMAIALRTMVIPTQQHSATPASRQEPWQVHIQTGAGIVADSNPNAEFEETVSKAAALGRAIDLAEKAFASPTRSGR